MSEAHSKCRSYFPGHYGGLHLSPFLSGAFLCWYPKNMPSLPPRDYELSEEEVSSDSLGLPRQKVKSRQNVHVFCAQIDRTKSLA